MRRFAAHLRRHRRPPARPSTGRALGGALAAALALGHATAATQLPLRVDEGDDRITGFSIPNTRAASALATRGRAHLAAERWNEAIESLQDLIEYHRAELIPVEERGAGRAPLHRGAAGWATEELLRLPEAGRALYRNRFAKRARAALELARRRGDRQALVELAERWPATEEAVLAWWTLGDLELETGSLELAREAWARALARRLQELEGGALRELAGDTPDHWQGAAERLAAGGRELAAGETRRLELALATLSEEAHPLLLAADPYRAHQGSLRLPGPGEGDEATPRPDASTWPRPFKIPSPHPFEPGNSGNLFPVRVGDTVLLSNSLQLFAINAYSGALRWASDKPPGWERLGHRREEEFFEGIALRDTMIAPAASERIVVSAHQVPVSDLENATFRNIAITTIIPDRRLYAYDVETGEELWNHHPPPNWDGESGSFTDRVSVAGPPVVSASRVIVPVHRMYGRIEFYVACFDLVTGEPLWTTQLVSGQRELNMFARAEREFSAPPVRIEADRVVVLTQLGAVATLDLFSGSILWETLYDQIVPPARSSFSAQRIKNYWRNAPPVVADGVIVVTPFDSRELLGLDLETGETLWSIRYSEVDELAGPYRNDVDLLLGADEHTVYLGGWPVMALRSSGGLRREEPRELAWRYPAGEIESDRSTAARALLLADRILIPTRDQRIEVDRFGGGRRHKSVPWKSGRSGNMLVEDGTLYTLTSSHLDGYFEWDMLLARARAAYEEAGGDREASLYLASLLSERSRTELESGHTARAREWLVEAEELLRPFLAGEEVDPRVAAEMHELLRTRGRVYIDLADAQSALEALQAARAWAPDLPSLRDTLIEEYAFVYGADEGGRRQVLDSLDESCQALSIAAVIRLGPELPYGWRFEPVVAEPEESFAILRLPLGLWTTLERAALAARSESPASELAELHELIEEWPEQPIPDREAEESLAEFATRRIGELIEQYGREPHEEFEAQAQADLDEARATEDHWLLARIGELYPWSFAAREANDQLLRWATSAGDVEEVARIALSELPPVWAPELADERELQLMAHLAATLDEAGNRAYSASLLGALAARAPELASTAPAHEGLSLAELAAEAAASAETPGGAEPAEFAPDARSLLRVPGRHRYLGAIPPAAGESEFLAPVLLFARDDGLRGRAVTLVAYASDSLALPEPRSLWSVTVPQGEVLSGLRDTVAFAPGKVLIATPSGVYAFDRDDGSEAWDSVWLTPEGTVESVRSEQGLVLVSVRVPSRMDRVHALDWSSGGEIWQTEFEEMRQDGDIVVGEGRVVLMPKRSQRRGVVLDLFSGRRVVDFALPTPVYRTAIDAAWIENGLLVVPWFLSGRNAERNHVVAIDLWSGELAWSIRFSEVAGGRRELRSIVQHAGRTFLLLRPALDAAQEGVRSVFLELHVGRQMGATARVGTFEQRDDQRLIGVLQERREVVDSPYLYLYSFDEGETLSLQCLDLPYGSVRWTQPLPVTRDEIHNSLMPLPVESETTVALIVTERGEQRLGTEVSSLHTLDRRTGRRLASLRLDPDLGTCADVAAVGLGRCLILAGEDMLEVLR